MAYNCHYAEIDEGWCKTTSADVLGVIWSYKFDLEMETTYVWSQYRKRCATNLVKYNTALRNDLTGLRHETRWRISRGVIYGEPEGDIYFYYRVGRFQTIRTAYYLIKSGVVPRMKTAQTLTELGDIDRQARRDMVPRTTSMTWLYYIVTRYGHNNMYRKFIQYHECNQYNRWCTWGYNGELDVWMCAYCGDLRVDSVHEYI